MKCSRHCFKWLKTWISGGVDLVSKVLQSYFRSASSVANGFPCDSQVEIRPMMYVALTYDHRLVDGREAVTFLRKIKAVVEDPRVLLLDM